MKPPTLLFVALTAAALLLAALAGAALVIYTGVYDVSATRQHTQWVYSLLDTALRQSVRRQARDINPPSLDDTARIQRGAACFQAKCVQCHGAPGVAASDIGKSMQPVPGPLVNALQRWHPPRDLLDHTPRHQDERHAGLGVPVAGQHLVGHRSFCKPLARIDAAGSFRPRAGQGGCASSLASCWRRPDACWLRSDSCNPRRRWRYITTCVCVG